MEYNPDIEEEQSFFDLVSTTPGFQAQLKPPASKDAKMKYMFACICGAKDDQRDSFEDHSFKCDLFKMSYSDIFQLVDKFTGDSADAQQLMNVYNVLGLIRNNLKGRINASLDAMGIHHDVEMMPAGDPHHQEEEVKMGHQLAKESSWQRDYEQFMR